MIPAATLKLAASWPVRAFGFFLLAGGGGGGVGVVRV